MKFLVIEGLDGSGKSTQIELLKKYLKKNNLHFKYLHFPRTDSPVFGELVAKFLRGEFGELNTVNPYLVALIYAGDRDNAKNQINKWLKKYLVIVDRYIYSNMAFQCAKIDDQNKKAILREWIRKMEFDYYKIPKPDLNIFLDVPFEFTINNLGTKRKGNDRNYLKGKKDIHEASLDFQKKVRHEYLFLSKTEVNYKIIDCSKEKNTILTQGEIHQKIIELCIINNIF